MAKYTFSRQKANTGYFKTRNFAEFMLIKNLPNFAGYWGDKCQYQDECDKDIDCNQGQCVTLGGGSLPRKQCFCPESHHGNRCSLKNPSDMPRQNSLDLKKHVKVQLDDRVTMYFKVRKKTKFAKVF